MIQRLTLAMLAALATITGCATTAPPTVVVRITEYDRAFDAAVESARQLGMVAAIRDRRGGVIETEPQLSPSMLEFWRPAFSPPRAAESTLSFQRHRARFEFRVPTEMDDEEAPEPPAASPTDALLLALDKPVIDLTQHHGPLVLSVTVEVERSFTAGVRRSTWSRRGTTRSIIIDPASGEPIPGRWWTPVSRDPDLERRLMMAVVAILDRG